MSRSVALLPFEISRWAPEPLDAAESEEDDALDGSAPPDEPLLDDEQGEIGPVGEGRTGAADEDDDSAQEGEEPLGLAADAEEEDDDAIGERALALAADAEDERADEVEQEQAIERLQLEAAALDDVSPAVDAGETRLENEDEQQRADEVGEGAPMDAAREQAAGELEQPPTPVVAFPSFAEALAAQLDGGDVAELETFGVSENLEASELSESNEGTEAVSIEPPELEEGTAPELDEEAARELDGETAPTVEHAWLARADRVALGRWMRGELVALLMRSRVLTPAVVELEDEAELESEELDDLELSLSAEPVAEAALATGTGLALACRLRADAEAVELAGLLADAQGEERVRFTLAAPLGQAHLLPRRAARELLLALGEDAAAAAIPEAAQLDDDGFAEDAFVDPEAVLELVRGARALDEAHAAPAGSPVADTRPALGELLEALARAPSLLPARDLILRGAEAASDGAAMPDWLDALEQLALLRPGDAQVLLALSTYRRLHHDHEGARELLLRARDLAAAGAEEAEVLSALAALAESEGRHEEAIQHLRAATRLADDPELHLRLGQILRLREPQESARSFQRAVVLDPEQARLRLALARQLQLLGETGRAATEAARAAQLAEGQPELVQSATSLLGELIETARAE